MRLLLAEDEKALSRALVKILEKNNYSVDPVYNGKDAIDYLGSGEYDGAILDIMMPGADGIEVLKTVRASGNAVPIIMLTAKSETEDKVLGLDSGADDYLAKPFDASELLARIRAMTRKGIQKDSGIRFGNLKLDRASFELSSATGSFVLTGKEYQLTEKLFLSPNAIISTEKLFESIWGFDSDAEMNVVWVYVSYLRKKFAALGANVEIKAYRGAGYKLEVKK